MKLNGWHRLGIIASVLWILIGGCCGNESAFRQGDAAVDAYIRCSDLPYIPDSRCSAEFQTDYAAATADHWLVAAIYAFVPVVLAWLLAWIILALTRWVRRGFLLAKI